MGENRRQAVLLMGPTASGKSRLALELGAVFPIEIVSADSAQVYLGMDIGTAKPSREERAEVPHHLIDLVPPTEPYSVARFRRDALCAIESVRSRDRVAVVVGGTMLYCKALLEGLSRLPEADERVRAELDREARANGWQAMHAALQAVDPETASRLQPGDGQRIQRALEVYRLTGQPMSRLLAAGRDRSAREPFHAICLMPSDRAQLHQAIDLRFTRMLQRGLVEELVSLRERYRLSPDLPSMRTVGYRQAWEHLEGRYDRSELRLRGIYATRQLAKRQMTWIRSWPDAEVIDSSRPDVASRVQEAVLRAVERRP